MKALTISQPYASLIASGEKWVENRTWPTDYRGLLAIHAGKGTQYLDKHDLNEYPTGCVIAVAKLIDCLERRFIHPGDLRLITGTSAKALRTYGGVASHQHTEGPWCWVFDTVFEIKHVPVRGAQGLWEWRFDPAATGEPMPTGDVPSRYNV